MKKFLLSAAAVSMAMCAMAQVEMPSTNLIQNGFFEEGVDQLTRGYDNSCVVNTKDERLEDADGNPILDAEGKEQWTSTPIPAIPGWNMQWNPWCVRIDIRDNEADYETIFEGNKYLLHIFRFNDNGWTDGGVTQVVKGLEIGKKYTLGALMAYNQGTLAGSWDCAEHGYIVTPCDAEGNDIVGDAIAKDDFFPLDDAWADLAAEFTATTSAVKIKFYIVNHTYEGNHSEGQWMDVDDVVLMPTDDYNTFKENREAIQEWQNAGIAEVIADGGSDAVLGVYNLQGVEVAKTTDGLKGLYIVRTAKGGKKVVL